jgi:arabinan endo-1,5-alpha-L-arabinosidase
MKLQFIIILAGLVFNFPFYAHASLPDSLKTKTAETKHRTLPANAVHDPVMIKEGDIYYVLGTGRGISVKKSTDRVHWTNIKPVFVDSTHFPAWHRADIPDQNRQLWAPDIHYRAGLFHLYYAVSGWMNFKSSIGYATNKTLNQQSPDYKWIDRGKVIDFRNGGEGVNCIDPNVFIDDDGREWLFYGSFKAGLRMVELNPKTGKLISKNPQITTITTSLGEGVFVVKANNYYYIFASRGRCCAGLESTYEIVVGRYKKLKGPYLNKKGESWVDNHYTVFLAGDYNEPGRGHNGFFTERDTTFIVYHAYTRSANGASLLNIKPVYVGKDGWPTMEPTGIIFFAHSNLINLVK